jgi:hypothetical protein
VAASEKMHRIVNDGQIDEVMEGIRDQLTELYGRVRHLNATVKAAYETIKIAEGED